MFDSSSRIAVAIATILVSLSFTGAPAPAEPPPWAPAHGYRAKKGQSAARQLPPGLQEGQCRYRMFDKSAVGALTGRQGNGRLAWSDEVCFTQTFEHAPDRETITWGNTRRGAEYQVTPTKTVKTRSGEYCREYQATASVGGKITKTYGTACRQPDGSWKLIN